MTEILHGIPVVDPYRWLEDGASQETREWLNHQTRYARAYLDSLPGREYIRIWLDSILRKETPPIIQRFGDRYFRFQRMAGQEQHSIYYALSSEGPWELLIDPARHPAGSATAIRVLSMSPDGRLLAYSVKQGGDSFKAVEILDLQSGRVLPDGVPRGLLRGFSFRADSKGFLYVREGIGAEPPMREAKLHWIGDHPREDRVLFSLGAAPHVRLLGNLLADGRTARYIVRRAEPILHTDHFIHDIESDAPPQMIARRVTNHFDLHPYGDRWFVCTDHFNGAPAPNRAIGSTSLRAPDFDQLTPIVPESAARIQNWQIQSGMVLVNYVEDVASCVRMWSIYGEEKGTLPLPGTGTCHLLPGDVTDSEVRYIFESFSREPATYSFDLRTSTLRPVDLVPAKSTETTTRRVWYTSIDGTRVHMFVVGRRHTFDRIDRGEPVPALLTGYGASGTCLTPQFSQVGAFMTEHGGIFCVANIRGGSEFGDSWYQAAKGRHRQRAIDDFIAAAEWLIARNYTRPDQLAIAGGSNSGALVGAALTQRPELFACVLCLAPLLDMLRYHKFQNTQFYVDNLGNPDHPDDFAALRAYSPYHNVRAGVNYPAVYLLGGDADRRCDPMHPRKMTAALQGATSSGRPVVLDYSELKGHSVGLPLHLRIDSLTDRLAFLCRHIGISLEK